MAITAFSNSDIEAGLSSAQQKNMNKVDASVGNPKRCNSRGVRIVGSRIYDSANGITCHQCRQKTRDFAASCKNLNNGKPCPIKFCCKCLLHRYGENAEEVEQLGNWMCPKCRNFCNCSFCRKKRGELPTGQLFRIAKAIGFKSVSEMLVANTSESKVLESFEEHKHVNSSSSDEILVSKVVSPMKPIVSEKELVVFLSGEIGKENSSKRHSSLKLDPVNTQKKTSVKKSKKTKREELKEISNRNNVDSTGKKKNHKRFKICNEVPNEGKGNINDDTKSCCNKIFEKETKVDSNHECCHTKILLANEVKGKSLSGGQTQGHRNYYPISGDPTTNLIGPLSLAPKQDMHHKHGENWNSTVMVDSCADVQVGIARFASVGMNLVMDKIEEEIPLPRGAELTKILDIELPPEDVGNALQLLEFCRVFGKALDLKKGEAEAMLRELVRKQNLRRGQSTLVVQFQIRVLTIILDDSENESPSLSISNGSNSWLKPLKNLIAESDHILKDFPLDWLQEGNSGYQSLDLSKKLIMLNFLCDEALGTDKLRSCIEDQNSRHKEEAKSKIAVAIDKEKSLRQKLQDEMVKAILPNQTPLQMEKHNALLAKLRSEVAQAHAEVLMLKGALRKEKHSSDALRIKPEFLDNGKAFWKLKSYNGECAVLLQDIKIQDEIATRPEENWFVYGPEKKDEVDKYIFSRVKRL